MNKEISTKYGQEISLNGYSLQTLYLSLDNYIKKGDFNKAIYVGIELDIFQCVSEGERIFKNFIKKLMLIYLEDLGVSAIGIWKDLNRIFESIDTSKNKGEITQNVINIINTYAKNNHSNLGIYFNYIYLLKNNKKLQEYIDYFPTVKKIYDDINEKTKNISDPKVIKNIYYESLKNRDLDSFYWAKLIDENTKIKKEEKIKYIFDTYKKVLEDENKTDKITDIARDWYLKLEDDRYLTYFIPIIFLCTNKGYLGKIFDVEDWKKYVYINITKPAIKLDVSSQVNLSDEVSFNELKDFYNFSKLLIDRDVVDETYLKTYINPSNLFPLTNYSMYEINVDDEEFKSVEHFYQAMKYKNDIEMYNKIKNSKNSLDAKKLGEDKIYKNKKEAISILEKGLNAKYSQHPELNKLLLDTKGNILYKLSDPFLGTGFNDDGENIVGKILQKIRDSQNKIKIPESVYYFENKPENIKRSKSYIAFDIDGTLVSPSNILLPNVKDILSNIYKQGKNIVLISNQKRRHIGDPKLKQKLEKIALQIDLPFIAFCSREENEYRKPNTGIFNLIPKNFGKIEMYVGDAAGRKNDHSDDDLKFAENLGVEFKVSDKFFTKQHF